MRLTRQAEIAIDVLALCAIRNPGTVTTRETADSAGTTKNHAAQVVAKLSRAGYLEGVRGRLGGIRLAKPPSAINVGEVLRLADPVLAAIENDAAGDGASVGAFDMLRRAAVEAYLSTFDVFTIADLVATPSGGRIGCLGCDLNPPTVRACRLRSPGLPSTFACCRFTHARAPLFGTQTLKPTSRSARPKAWCALPDCPR